MRIVALDSGRLVYANNAALVIFRAASFEDVAGRNAFEFMPEVQPDGRTSEEIVIEMNKTEVASAEFVCNRMDGDTFVARITSRTIMYAGRLCSLATIEDMTEEKAYHEMLERTAQMEKEANSLKSRFLATMSHEIRTPLNAILGVAEIQLQKKNLPPDTEDAFLRIYESGDLLVNIVNDILDLSKIEAGKLEIVPVRYDLRGLVSDAAQFNRIRYENKPIELDVRVSEGTPAGLIGDELRIRQILNNILSNAFKYTDEGCIALNVSSEPAPDGVVLIFEVSDTGQGMSVSQQERLFDEYTRFNTDVNRSILGAGLGMGITKRLLELMNGEITVRSEPRKGSAFTIRIPQGLAGDGACGAELSDMLGASRFRKASVIKKTQFARESLPHLSVLVVDDMESNIFVTKGMLAPYGLKTDTASSGGEAIKRIEQGNAYDIIFMDHMMPVMDGVETTRRLREMGYKGKIIALTANVLAGQDEVFMRNGFDGFISKPIDSRELDGVLVGFIPAAPPVTPRLTPRAGTAAPDELKRCFVIDARRAIDTLEGFRAQGRPANDADFEGYTTVVHGMKSALANIGEADLSAAALRLENAGRARDAAFVTYKTPPFITALRKLSEELSAPDDSENVEMGDADRRLLREGLDALATACAAFDKPAAKAALDGLRQKKWPREVGGVLDEIAAHLLHSAFGKAAATAKSI